jgi:hypothetical protein
MRNVNGTVRGQWETSAPIRVLLISFEDGDGISSVTVLTLSQNIHSHIPDHSKQHSLL